MTREHRQVAFVTGASSGIGRAIAVRLAQDGCDVGLVGRDPGRLREVAEEIRSLGARAGTRAAGTRAPETGTPGTRAAGNRVVGVRAVTAVADVRKEEDVVRAIQTVQEELGPIDIAVNSAGISLPEFRDVEHLSPAQWQEMIEINLHGTYYVCHHLVPQMKKRRKGAIVNVGSTAAHRCLPGNTAYAASKYGVRALTEGLAEECDGTGVRVFLVSPGPVDTPIWDKKSEPVDQAWRAELLRPEDIAEIVSWWLHLPPRVRIDEILVRPTSNTSRLL